MTSPMLPTLAILATCWTSMDVPQQKPGGYALDGIHLSAAGAELAVAWSDGQSQVATGPENDLRAWPGLPRDQPGVAGQPIASSRWALWMSRYDDRLELFGLRDGGWASETPLVRAKGRVRSQITDHALAALPDGGVVAVWNQRVIDDPYPTHLEAAAFANGAWLPLTVAAQNVSEIVSSVDPDGKVSIAWLSSKTVRAARLEGSRFVPIGTVPGKASAYTLRLTFTGRDAVVGFREGRLIRIARWSAGKWTPINSPPTAETAWGLALAGAPDGTLVVGWTEKDPQGQFVGIVERFDGTTWTRLAGGLQLDPGDNHVGDLALAARARDDVLIAFDEEFGEKRIRLVRLRPCEPNESPRDFAVSKPPKTLWPQSVEEAAARLVAEMDAKFKDRVRDTPRGDLIAFHHGWGTGIRNGFGLWRGNEPLLKSCGKREPDGCSMVIIERVWELLQQADAGVRAP